MQAPVKILFFVLGFILFGYHGNGQDTTLNIRLNKTTFKPGETIRINASQSSTKHSTLFLIAEDEKGFVWEMRWPMLGGASESALIIPDSMPQGQYRLFFAVLQNLFTVFGKVKTPEKIDELSVTFLTAGGDVFEDQIDVEDNGHFSYRNILFENSATMVFTHPNKKRNDKLDIEITTVLDSAAYPLRKKIVDIFIGQSPPVAGLKPFTSINVDTDARARMLETVIVVAKPLKRADIFNKKYSNGLFKDMNERVFDFLDDPFLANSISVLQTLRGRVAGLNMTYGAIPSLSWRGQPVACYLDEIRVSADMLDATPVDNIAIVKVYPPPFFGNPGGNGGAIAVYTKRGGLTDDNFRNAFKVKGYTPPEYTLPTMPDRF